MESEMVMDENKEAAIQQMKEERIRKKRDQVQEGV
jgi:hypothetical protein